MITLNPTEELVLVLRRHWFIFALQVALALFFALIPPIAGVTLARAAPEFFVAAAALFAFAASIYYLTLWLAFFATLADYYLDVWIVTSERVIAIEQRGLFRREAAEFNILRVQDVSTHINGFIATALDFGELQVQTAGEEKRFCFKQVPNPNRAKQCVLDCYEAAVKRARQHHDETMLPQSTSGL
ncbi:PH domain-containing protein [Candidatus Parcubacteria bacterium]|nr:PH domain-containing protein [Candidatus Parcubacteria bacterium]